MKVGWSFRHCTIAFGLFFELLQFSRHLSGLWSLNCHGLLSGNFWSDEPLLEFKGLRGAIVTEATQLYHGELEVFLGEEYFPVDCSKENELLLLELLDTHSAHGCVIGIRCVKVIVHLACDDYGSQGNPTSSMSQQRQKLSLKMRQKRRNHTYAHYAVLA